MIHYQNLQLYLRLGLNLKNTYRVLEFNQYQWLKQYFEFNTRTKRIEAEENGDKDGKGCYKLMNNAVYVKKSGKLKKQNRCKTCKQQKRLFKMDIQTNPYVTQNI